MNIDGYALIIGGSSGIGKACALAFAKEGAAGVVVADINKAEAHHVVTACEALATHAEFCAKAVHVDVTQEESMDRVTREMRSWFGRIDYCVNCAGVSWATQTAYDPPNHFLSCGLVPIGVELVNEVAQADVPEFNRFMEVNVKGSLLVLRYVSASMKLQDPRPVDKALPARGTTRGAIVTLGSASSFASTPGMVQYTTSKFAVLGLSKNAALDNAAHGIRVNCLCPSWVDTPMIQKAMAGVEGLMQSIESAVPLGRIARVEEIADCTGQDSDKMADNKQHKYRQEIQQMMYVSGETGEPSTETTFLIEEIVRQQVIEMLRNCTELAARRGARSIAINDLIFLIRDDAPKVSRLRTFLSWKDVRKNARDSDEKGGDVELGVDDAGGPAGAMPGAGPVEEAAKKNKKAKVKLPWEPSSFYSQEVPELDDEEDEEEEELNFITLERLRKADERTKVMTREEYVTWSEYRQASFTYRKGKRFREWAGFGVVTDSKPSDDVVDILGFLTFEMVQTLTEEALKIKEQEDMWKERTGGESSSSKKRKLGPGGLFDPPSEGKTPVESRHIHEAFRRLQTRSKKSRAMLNGTRLQSRTNLRLF
ncbi:hypothetical protein SCAR479_09700 [Seiridium cardinale]|uniref:Uncharacterized protein n=1 Tax=Seiridium cardinale TaxID=138064 RepID=A0ABR2XIG9_9PEZI